MIGQIHDIIRKEKLTDRVAANNMEIPVVDVDIILRGDVEDRYSKNDLRRLLRKIQKATSSLAAAKPKARKSSNAFG